MDAKGATGRSDIVPYMAPMIAYVALGALESYLPSNDGQPSPVWYPLAYTARVVVVALVAWRYRATWSDFRPWPSAAVTGLAVLIGVIVWGLWIGLDGHYPALPFLGKRVAFDLGVMSPAARWAFVGARMVGLVVIVPLDRRAFLAIVLDSLADRPGIRKGADRADHAVGGGRHLGLVCARASGMAAGAIDGSALGLAALVDAVARCLSGEPRHGQPGAGTVRDRRRRLEILVDTNDHPMGD